MTFESIVCDIEEYKDLCDKLGMEQSLLCLASEIPALALNRLFKNSKKAAEVIHLFNSFFQTSEDSFLKFYSENNHGRGAECACANIILAMLKGDASEAGVDITLNVEKGKRENGYIRRARVARFNVEFRPFWRKYESFDDIYHAMSCIDVKFKLIEEDFDQIIIDGGDGEDIRYRVFPSNNGTEYCANMRHDHYMDISKVQKLSGDAGFDLVEAYVYAVAKRQIDEEDREITKKLYRIDDISGGYDKTEKIWKEHKSANS